MTDLVINKTLVKLKEVKKAMEDFEFSSYSKNLVADSNNYNKWCDISNYIDNEINELEQKINTQSEVE